MLFASQLDELHTARPSQCNGQMRTVGNGCDAAAEKAARRRGSRRHINAIPDANAFTVGAASRVDADDSIR